MRNEINAAFLRQRWRAVNGRGLEWNLSFDEWWDIWQQSGKWDQRGTSKGKYCMSRKNDTGAYELGNVFIQLSSDNVSQARVGKPVAKLIGVPRTEEVKEKIRISLSKTRELNKEQQYE